MQELRKANQAAYDKIVAEARKASADYAREYSLFDEETIAAVDTFRKDNGLDYQGDAAGLVDARFINALRAAYIAKKKTL
jgi:hypothetical protein